MRFGTMVPQGWKHDLEDVANDAQWDCILDVARTIEADGWDSLWVYDHFHTHPVVTHESVFDAWTLIASIAAVTNRVRIGQMCTCILYRPPSLLAKMAATFDAISKGRLDVGIGAGWSDKEFAAYGYDYPSDQVRLEMLDAAEHLAGTVEQVSDIVGQYADAGCAEIILYFYDMCADMGVLESQSLFASEIIPQHQ